MGGENDERTVAAPARTSLWGLRSRWQRRMLVGCTAVMVSTSIVGACGSAGKRTDAKRTSTTVGAGSGSSASRSGRSPDADPAPTDHGTTASGKTTPGGVPAGPVTTNGAGRGGAPDGAPSGGAEPKRTGGSSAVFGMARASVRNVVLLHNLAVGLGRANGLPGDITSDESVRVADQFQGDQRAAEVLEKSDPSAASFAAVQGAYASLARALHTAAGSTDKALPASFADDLAAVDKRWRAALTVIGRDGGVDLLANVPPLLLPQRPATTIPPPPN